MVLLRSRAFQRSKTAQCRRCVTTPRAPSVFLWTNPGTVGASAWANMFPGHQAFAEPFTIPFTFGNPEVDLLWDLVAHYPKDEANLLQTHTTAVCQRIAQHGAKAGPRQAQKPAFVSELCYFIRGRIGLHPFTAEWLQGFRHTFLIAHPRQTVPAVYAEVSRLSQPFDPSVMGYDVMQALVAHLDEAAGRPDTSDRRPIIVDAADIATAPEAVATAYCTRLGLPAPPPRALLPQPEVAFPDGPAAVQDCIDQCIPAYEALHALRIVPEADLGPH